MTAGRIVAAVSLVSVAVGVPLVAGLTAGASVASSGVGWSVAEGLIVGGVAVLGEVVAVAKFGGYVRRRAAAERLAARNARIRAARAVEPLESSAL